MDSGVHAFQRAQAVQTADGPTIKLRHAVNKVGWATVQRAPFDLLPEWARVADAQTSEFFADR
jgi:hypothetical protein